MAIRCIGGPASRLPGAASVKAATGAARAATRYDPRVSLAKIAPDVPTLLARLAPLRTRGGQVVFTNGCFDLLHPGHVRYLTAARALGDVLVVALNSDASVRRLKGAPRPVLTVAERAEVLAALAAVDHVVAFEDDTPLALVTAVRPDVLVKGADWAEADIAGAPEVRSWGGRVERVSLVPGVSTTELLRRIRAT
jgi:D-beta-D-heptose 7-phosphate kinase/D-beta-D-heptose 1-phosphate adenosyltransferase